MLLFAALMMSPPRRKKWSEAEEKSLIERYGEMVSAGDLAKMKTREKKFRPIAFHVNRIHHDRDPVSYPWQWTWKDVSTKVQNMRHQYLLVKQKIKKPELSIDDDSISEEFDWLEGASYWSNFLRYKEVFGDVPLSNDPVLDPPRNEGNDHDFEGGSHGTDIVAFGNLEQSGDGDFDGGDNGVSRLGFEYDGEEREENFNGSSNHLKDDGDDGLVYEEVEANGSESKRKKESKKTWGFVMSQVRQLKEMQILFEQRERERQRREQISFEREKKRERKMGEMEKEREEREKARKRLRIGWREEWEAMEKESQERERRRREEMVIQEREWEERMNIRRSEWTKRMDEMMNHHRVEMGQLQSRILNEQQNLVSQLLGIISQWTGHTSALSDHTSASNHYLAQMMQSLHHVNGLVHDDTRVEGDNQDDQFIVDG